MFSGVSVVCFLVHPFSVLEYVLYILQCGEPRAPLFALECLSRIGVCTCRAWLRLVFVIAARLLVWSRVVRGVMNIVTGSFGRLLWQHPVYFVRACVFLFLDRMYDIFRISVSVSFRVLFVWVLVTWFVVEFVLFTCCLRVVTNLFWTSTPFEAISHIG